MARRSSAAPHKDQLSFGPLPLRNSECRTDDAAFVNDEKFRSAERFTAEVLDAAFKSSRLENKQAADTLGKSASLIEKWRSAEQCGSPSIVQLVVLGKEHPEFGSAVMRGFCKRCGRLVMQALSNVICDLGVIAAAVGR
jgi:hypothetical protein